MKQFSFIRRLAPAWLLLACLLCGLAPAIAVEPAPAGRQPLRIGIIGTGNIGGALATHWAQAGHEVMISSRHPEQLAPLAAQLGPRAQVGTPAQAARFGEVVLVSVPYAALPQIGRDLRAELAGKVVIDTGNPYPGRDGAMAEQARREGAGIASQRYLPGTHLVRAFNAISAGNLRSLAHRRGSLVAIPIAGDDARALQVASQLVRDAGFEPVTVGGLAQARRFDVGSPVYVQVMDAPQLRGALGLRQ